MRGTLTDLRRGLREAQVWGASLLHSLASSMWDTHTASRLPRSGKKECKPLTREVKELPKEGSEHLTPVAPSDLAEAGVTRGGLGSALSQQDRLGSPHQLGAHHTWQVVCRLIFSPLKP